MKPLMKILKWTGITVVLLVLVLVIAVSMRQHREFDAPLEEIKASTDTAIINRGRDLVYGPLHCAHCHTPIEDFDRVEKGELVPLTGGHKFILPIGTLTSKNLTPHETGIGKLTDAEIARTLRHGIGSDGRAIIDMMPFQHMSRKDMVAVISFLRSQAPVKNEVPPTEWNMLGKVINAFMLKPTHPWEPIPEDMPEAPTVEYGKYLANSLANCRGCHTKRDLQTGAYIGPDFAGGFHIESELEPGVFLTSPNITPDPETGKMAGWDLDKFIKRFREGKLIPASIMPWGPFSRMSDVQLEALYRYLNSIEPVKNDPGPILSDK